MAHDQTASDKTTSASVAGKRVLITGGTTGIGRAILLDLVGQGAQVLTFGRHPEPLAETLQLAGLRPEAGLTADASRAEDIERVFAALDERLGGIDVLIDNAALGADPIDTMADQEWRYVVETNLMGYMACARAALARMEPQGHGHIVMISSISPEILAKGESVYAATKAGINAFGLTLRKELGDKNIRISIVEPGSVGSDMQPCTPEQQREAIAKGEMLFAEEIAAAVRFIIERVDRCDVAMMRVEPVRQKTG